MKYSLSRWLPLVLWMVVIFLISASPNPYRAAANEIGLPTPTPGNEIRPIPALANDILGVFSHFGEYLLLGILAYHALRPSNRQAFIALILLCGLFALSDEVHQIFVPGRAFQLTDLSLDSVGILLGVLVAHGLMPIFNNNLDKGP